MTRYVSDDSETVARMNSAKKKDFCHNFRKYTREYSEVTGIHGLRYVTEKRSRTEKVIWTILLLISLAGCIYMIYEVLYKYQNSPVVVSFATEDTPLHEIPFPAITICPESKYSHEQFNYTDVVYKLSENKEVDETDMKIYSHLRLLCDYDPYANKSSTVDNTFYDTLAEVKLDADNMFPSCSFNNKDFDCADAFTPILIDEGICYSFNIFDRDELFREHVFHYKDYNRVENKSRAFFDVENGYKTNAGLHAYPRRALMSGADNALEIYFHYDTSDSDFMCNSVFQGFRVLIHNPWDVPRLSKHHFRIPFKKVVIAAVEPSLIKTSESVRKFVPEKRKCYMRDERPLHFFQEYSQPNCLLECTTNYTLNKCGCVNFFMPRDNSTAICADVNCLEAAEEELKVKQMESKISGKSYCDCKPSCTNLMFNVETSHSDFYFKEFFQAHREMNISLDNTITTHQWSVLQVYFKDEQFITVERNELYGVSDLISNLGGLLGLFTGFSLISLMELIYFCSLRAFCNERMYGLWSGPPS